MNRQRCLLFFFVLIWAVGLAKAASDVIYNEKADARKLVRAAIARASHEHKNIVLDFGGNWCEDCHVLEAQMEKPELASLIRANFIVVNVDVARFDKNLDLARKYHVPLKKGVPALAVLDRHGKLLYSQEQGEFENARSMTLESIRAFFEEWKPKR
jgi:thiol-disulfide isomerase/thioredoxin